MSRGRAALLGIGAVVLSLVVILSTLPYGTPNIFYPDRIELDNSQGEILFISDYSRLEMWDLECRTIRNKTWVNSSIRALDFSQETGLLIGTNNGEIIILDSNTLETLSTCDLKENITTLKWTGEAEILVALETGEIVLLDINGREKMSLQPKDGEISAIDISSNGTLLSVCYFDSEMVVLNLSRNGSQVFQENGTVTACSFSPQGSLAVITDDGRVLVRDTHTWNITFTAQMRYYSIYRNFVFWSDEGARLYASGGSQAFEIWDTDTGTIIRDKSFQKGWVRWVSLGDNRLAVATKYHVYVYDLTGEEITYLPEEIETPLFAPVAAATIIFLVGLVAVVDKKRRREWDRKDAIFMEKRVPLEEMTLLSALGVYLFIIGFMYFEIQARMIDEIPWFVAIMGAILGTYACTAVLARPLPLIIERERIGVHTTPFHLYFKGKTRWISPSEIKRISPYYFYNRLTKVTEENGVDIVLIDGSVVSIRVNPTSRFMMTSDDIKEYLKEVLGKRWEAVYVDEPYIDMEKWEKLKPLTNKKTWKVMLIFMLEVLLPVFTFQILMFLFPEVLGTIYEAGMLWPFLIGVFAVITGVVIYAVLKQAKYNTAITMKAILELKNGMENEITNKNRLDPEKYLHMSEKEWKEVEKIAGQFRLWSVSVALLMVSFFVTLIYGSMNENFPITMMALGILAILMLDTFYVYRIERANALIKKAANYELETGERIMPEDMNIPTFLGMSGHISRKPIILTEKEKKIAEKIGKQGEWWQIKMTIMVLGSVGLSLILITWTNLGGSLYLFLGLMMSPIILIMIYMWPKLKILAKVKEAERIEKILEKRRPKG